MACFLSTLLSTPHAFFFFLFPREILPFCFGVTQRGSNLSYTLSIYDLVLSTQFICKTWSGDPSLWIYKLKLFLFFIYLKKFADLCLWSSNFNRDAYYTLLKLSLGQERWRNSIIKKSNTGKIYLSLAVKNSMLTYKSVALRELWKQSMNIYSLTTFSSHISLLIFYFKLLKIVCLAYINALHI